MKTRISLAVLAVVVLGSWLSTPRTPAVAAALPELPADLVSWLAEREEDVDRRYGIVPGTMKRIGWHGEAGRRTEYAVVFVHGFSGSRGGFAPVPELVAASLGANLFETRLAGHGRETARMENVSAEDWLADTLEALAVGARLGEKIVLIGVSTGATLAIALADHELFDSVDSLILVSPNLGVDAAAAPWLTRPFGPLLARAMVGEYREFKPHNEAQARLWTTRYPTANLVEMMRLVNVARDKLGVVTVPRALLVYSLKDRVVSPSMYLEAFEQLPAGTRERYEVSDSDDPDWHLLAGDVLSPRSSAPLAGRIAEFIQAGRPVSSPAAPQAR